MKKHHVYLAFVFAIGALLQSCGNNQKMQEQLDDCITTTMDVLYVERAAIIDSVDNAVVDLERKLTANKIRMEQRMSGMVDQKSSEEDLKIAYDHIQQRNVEFRETMVALKLKKELIKANASNEKILDKCVKELEAESGNKIPEKIINSTLDRMKEGDFQLGNTKTSE